MNKDWRRLSDLLLVEDILYIDFFIYGDRPIAQLTILLLR